MQIFVCGVLCAQPLLFAQDKAASPQRASVSVPFIGCKSDGQVGPREVPQGTSVAVPVDPKDAQGLAYYKSSIGPGVLAPRGWYCFGVYGSSGSNLLLSPEPIDTDHMFAPLHNGFTGSAIEVVYLPGDTSGLYEAADIMARVFPDYRGIAIRAVEGLSLPVLTFGPFPDDVLTYKSKTAVEYKTPAQTNGLGTHSALKKNGSPIEGVAMLIGEMPQAPDLLLLSVRLPPELAGLMPAIVRQFERDAR